MTMNENKLMNLFSKNNKQSNKKRFTLLSVLQKACDIKLLLIIASLVSVSCSNTDSSIHYYSLNTIANQPQKASTTQHHKESTFVVLNTIELTDFLNTGSLVMQLDSHKIQLSNQHRWGNKLPNAIAKHLMSTLSSNNKNLYIERKNAKNIDKSDIQLTLYFEQFTITNNSESIIAGYYLIQSTLGDHRQKSYFDIRQPLTQDGYNHAVNTFNHSLDDLSQQIANELSALNTK